MLAAVEAIDSGLMFKETLNELLNDKISCVDLYMNNKSLYELTKTSNMVAKRRLLIDLSALREMVEKCQISI